MDNKWLENISGYTLHLQGKNENRIVSKRKFVFVRLLEQLLNESRIHLMLTRPMKVRASYYQSNLVRELWEERVVLDPYNSHYL